MKKNCFLFLLGLFVYAKGLVAQEDLTSQWQACSQMEEDTSKIRAMWLLSQKYQKQNVDTSILLAEKALGLSLHIGTKRQQYESWKSGWLIFHTQSKLERAKEWGHKAYELSKSIGSLAEQGGSLSDIGISCWRLGQVDSALYYYHESENFFLKSGENFWKVYSDIGRLYQETGAFDKAVFYLNKAAERLEKAHSRKDFGYVMYFLGEIYLEQSDFENFGRINDKWEEFKKEHPKKNEIGSYGGHIQASGIFFSNIKNKEEKLREGIAYELKLGDSNSAGNYLLTLGQLLLKENRLQEAKKLFRQAVEVQKESAFIQLRIEAIYELYQVNKKLDEPEEALYWFERHQVITDSLEKEEVLANLAELEVKYQTEQKEQALALKSLEARRATLERNILMAGLAIFGLLAFGFFYSYRKRIEVNRKLAEQQAQLQIEKIERLEQEQKVLNLNAMVVGQEKERQRIANDLHDSLGGLLTSVKLHFDSINNQKNQQPIFQKTNALIDEACVEVRRISHNMMPRALAFLGLKGALEDLVKDLGENNIQCELECMDISKELSSTSSIMLYRIVQELINNILKHANASELFIQMFESDDELNLMVEDNGSGFDVDSARNKKGLGLSSIESRVRFLSGNIHWDSVIGEGTTVNIIVPTY